jgi:hypothetical protein
MDFSNFERIDRIFTYESKTIPTTCDCCKSFKHCMLYQVVYDEEVEEKITRKQRATTSVNLCETCLSIGESFIK